MANRHFTGRMLLYTLMIITVVYTLLMFAVFSNIRVKAFSRVGALYTATFKTPVKTTVTRVEVHERKIVQMSPPPPASAPLNLKKKPLATTLIPSPVRPAAKARSQEVSETPETKEESPNLPPRASSQKPPTSDSGHRAVDLGTLVKGKDQETAYKNLLAGNKTMADLVNQSDPKLKFKTWSVLKSEGDEHWIDVVFRNTADDSEVHYTWGVNNASKKIIPINHYAKQLAAR